MPDMFLCTSQMIQPAETKLWRWHMHTFKFVRCAGFHVCFISYRVIISSHHLMLERDPSDVGDDWRLLCHVQYEDVTKKNNQLTFW